MFLVKQDNPQNEKQRAQKQQKKHPQKTTLMSYPNTIQSFKALGSILQEK